MYILFPRIRLRVSLFAIPSMLLLLWLEGDVAFLILLLSASLHELGHIAAMHILGYRIRRVDILPMGALIVCPEGIADIHEVKIALSGPFASLAAALVSSCVFAASGSGAALYAVVINLALGIFNLLPVRKLDGGKALSCYLTYKNKKNGNRICVAASMCAVTLFVTVAILCAVYTDYNLGVIVLSSVLLIQLI